MMRQEARFLTEDTENELRATENDSSALSAMRLSDSRWPSVTFCGLRVEP
jgi:hypothetical protein